MAGLIMLGTGLNDFLKPRARYVSAEPRPGTSVDVAPAAVTIRFDQALDVGSTIAVVSTVTLTPSDREVYSGQDVAAAAGVDSTDPEQRSLRADLSPGLPRGLYRVSWRAVAARARVWRNGEYYFGVGMSVPAHILSRGAVSEKDRGFGSGVSRAGREREMVLLAGLLLIGLGVLLPRLSQPHLRARRRLRATE